MTIKNTRPWKRNEIPLQVQTRQVLSSTFIDSEEDVYITSDYYGEERNDMSTPRSENETESDRSDSPTSCSSPAMDFFTFDGVWDDSDDERQIMDDDLPWHFIEFGFEEKSKVQTPRSKSPLNRNLHINTSIKLKGNKAIGCTPKSKLLRVYDTERQASKYPLQNITNTNERHVVTYNKVKGNEVKLQQATGESRLQSHQGNSEKGQNPTVNVQQKCAKLPWFTRNAPTPISTASTESLSPAFFEEDSFWGEIASQSNTCKQTQNLAYSDRSSVTDGSKVQSRLPEDMEKRSLVPNNVHLRTSNWTEMNKRAYMEDRIIIDSLGTAPLPTYSFDMVLLLKKLKALKSNSPIESLAKVPDTKPSLGPELPLSIFATFDGHAGSLASQYCSDWFSVYLQKQPSYPRDLPLALRTAFHNIDEDFVKSGNTDGSTACVCCVLGGKKVICANAGDSRAIIVKRDGRSISLSKDHKPGSPQETKRINDLGGRVIYSGRWRVEGRLAVSRAIGDSTLKKYITSDPDICEYDIRSDDWFLIVATDGIWDVLENDQVATMALSYSCKSMNHGLKVGKDNLKWTAQKICDRAKSLGSRDNLSVVLVDLQYHVRDTSCC